MKLLLNELLGVIVEALTRLSAQQAAADHLSDQRMGSILGVVSLVEQNVHDVQNDIPADQVAQLQGTQGMVSAQLHGSVDALGGSDALSIDNDPRTEATQKLFKTVQNKMHVSAHGHTAAEVIYSRANADKDFMGLTSWTGALPKRTDAGIAKNYLSPDELDTLNRIVSLYLDFAELQAKSHKPMYMKDWIQKLDEFLSLSGKELLTHAGTVSAEIAKQKADSEYDKYSKRIQYELSPVEIHFIESFEKEVKRLKK